MRSTLCVSMLALCLIALQCAADGEPDKPSPPNPPNTAEPVSEKPAAGILQPGSVSSQDQSQDEDKGQGQGQGEGVQEGLDNGDNNGTGQLGVGSGEAARSAEPSPSSGSSVSSSGSSSQGGATGLPAVPDSSTETTTTIKPKTADDNRQDAPKDKGQLPRDDRTSNLPPAAQDPKTKVNASSPTTHSAGTLKQSPEPPLPPTTNKEGEKIQDNTDNLVRQDGDITTTVKSEPVLQPPLNVNPPSNTAGHSSKIGGDPEDKAAKPIAGAIPPVSQLPGHTNTPTNPAKPPVSSSPLSSDGNTKTGQNTGTKIADPQTHTPTTLPKVKPSVNLPTPTNTINTSAANTIKPSTNSATVPAQNQAARNAEEHEPHQPQTLNTTTSTAAPTGPKETSVTSTTESAKGHSNAPAPPLPKLSTAMQSLDNKDSSIGSVSLFALTTLATLAVTVVLPAL